MVFTRNIGYLPKPAVPVFLYQLIKNSLIAICKNYQLSFSSFNLPTIKSPTFLPCAVLTRQVG